MVSYWERHNRKILNKKTLKNIKQKENVIRSFRKGDIGGHGQCFALKLETNETLFVNQASGVLKYKLSNNFQKCVDLTIKEISLWRN